MKQKRDFSKYLFMAAIIIPALALASCSSPMAIPPDVEKMETESAPAPAPTAIQETPTVVIPPPVPTPEKVALTYSEMQLTDGSKIIYAKDAKFDVVSVPDKGAKGGEVQLLLHQGEILIIPNPVTGNWISVKDASGYFSRVNGCSMMVMADPAAKEFGMDCLADQCEAGNPEGKLIQVKRNEAWTYKNGLLQGPGAINLVALETAFGKSLPECAAAIPVTGAQTTDTPQPVATLNAQATSSCNTFRAQFPGTPCP